MGANAGRDSSGTRLKFPPSRQPSIRDIPSRQPSLRDAQDQHESSGIAQVGALRVSTRHKKVLFLPQDRGQVTKVDVRAASTIPRRRLLVSQSLTTSPMLAEPIRRNSSFYEQDCDKTLPCKSLNQSQEVQIRQRTPLKFKVRLVRKQAPIPQQPIEEEPRYTEFDPEAEEEPLKHRASRKIKSMADLSQSMHFPDGGSRLSALAGLPVLSAEKPMRLAVYRPRVPPKNTPVLAAQEEAVKKKSRAEYSWKWKGENGAFS